MTKPIRRLASNVALLLLDAFTKVGYGHRVGYVVALLGALLFCVSVVLSLCLLFLYML